VLCARRSATTERGCGHAASGVGRHHAVPQTAVVLAALAVIAAIATLIAPAASTRLALLFFTGMALGIVLYQSSFGVAAGGSVHAWLWIVCALLGNRAALALRPSFDLPMPADSAQPRAVRRRGPMRPLAGKRP